jgi:hypothetical protein
MDNKSREIPAIFPAFGYALSSPGEGRRRRAWDGPPLRIMRALKGLIARCKRAVSIGAHLASFGSGIWANLFGVGESITPGVCVPQKGSSERGW